jgi:hypothetical protein
VDAIDPDPTETKHRVLSSASIDFDATQYVCRQSGIEAGVIRALPLVPAEPEFLADGTLYSSTFDDVYASAGGALDETRHVFLTGNGLPERWKSQTSFVVVETGFGTGLNFLATWAAWRETAAPGACLHFISVEKHPFRRTDLPRVLAALEPASEPPSEPVRVPPDDDLG